MIHQQAQAQALQAYQTQPVAPTAAAPAHTQHMQAPAPAPSAPIYAAPAPAAPVYGAPAPAVNVGQAPAPAAPQRGGYGQQQQQVDPSQAAIAFNMDDYVPEQNGGPRYAFPTAEYEQDTFYKIQVTKVEYTQYNGSSSFIVEYQVLESGHHATPVGTICKFIASSRAKDPRKDISGFLCVALGADPQVHSGLVTNEVLIGSVGPAQPVVGQILALKVKLKYKPGKKDFPNQTFSICQETAITINGEPMPALLNLPIPTPVVPMAAQPAAAPAAALPAAPVAAAPVAQAPAAYAPQAAPAAAYAAPAAAPAAAPQAQPGTVTQVGAPVPAAPAAWGGQSEVPY